MTICSVGVHTQRVYDNFMSWNASKRDPTPRTRWVINLHKCHNIFCTRSVIMTLKSTVQPRFARFIFLGSLDLRVVTGYLCTTSHPQFLASLVCPSSCPLPSSQLIFSNTVPTGDSEMELLNSLQRNSGSAAPPSLNLQRVDCCHHHPLKA